GKEIAPGDFTGLRHGALGHRPRYAANTAQQADPEGHPKGMGLEPRGHARERRDQTPDDAEDDQSEAASQRLDRLPEAPFPLIDLLRRIGEDSCKIAQRVVSLCDFVKAELGRILVAYLEDLGRGCELLNLLQ